MSEEEMEKDNLLATARWWHDLEIKPGKNVKGSKKLDSTPLTWFDDKNVNVHDRQNAPHLNIRPSDQQCVFCFVQDDDIMESCALWSSMMAPCEYRFSYEKSSCSYSA
jgi:hypothetical protein